MTAKKDLKKHIRARQAETGESYVTARRHVLAAKPEPEPEPEPEPDSAAPKRPPFHVDEMIDLTEAGTALGFRCEVVTTRSLADRVEPDKVLRRLRATIDATLEDPELERMRAVLLHGKRPNLRQLSRGLWLEVTRAFITRARAGIGGISEQGDMLAFALDGHREQVMVLVHIGWVPRLKRTRVAARVTLSAIGAVEDGLDSMSVLFVS